MSEENKDPMADQKKGTEEKTQLSEEALNKVAGGSLAGSAGPAAQMSAAQSEANTALNSKYSGL